MPRFAPVWGKDVERAITSAIVDGRMTAPEAARAAVGGKLPHPDDDSKRLELKLPVGVSKDTAQRRLVYIGRKWAKAEKDARGGISVPEYIAHANSPDEIAEAMSKRVMAAADAAIRREERRPAHLRDLKRIEQAAKVAIAGRGLWRGDKPPKTTTTKPGADAKPDGPGAAAQTLLASLRSGATQPTTTGGDDNTGERERQDHDHDQTEPRPTEQQQSGILTRASGQSEEDAERARVKAELGIAEPEAERRQDPSATFPVRNGARAETALQSHPPTPSEPNVGPPRD